MWFRVGKGERWLLLLLLFCSVIRSYGVWFLVVQHPTINSIAGAQAPGRRRVAFIFAPYDCPRGAGESHYVFTQCSLPRATAPSFCGREVLTEHAPWERTPVSLQFRLSKGSCAGTYEGRELRSGHCMENKQHTLSSEVLLLPPSLLPSLLLAVSRVEIICLLHLHLNRTSIVRWILSFLWFLFSRILTWVLLVNLRQNFDLFFTS